MGFTSLIYIPGVAVWICEQLQFLFYRFWSSHDELYLMKSNFMFLN